MQRAAQQLIMIALCLAMNACVRLQPQVVVITATPVLESNSDQVIPPTEQIALNLATPTALDAPALATIASTAQPMAATSYVVQPGDTLSGIAAQYGVSLETLLEANQITDANLISVGQILELPPEPNSITPSLRIISDDYFVRGPSSKQFDPITFVNQQVGYIRTVTDIVDFKLLSGAEVVQRVAQEYSVDARLLLAILEYQSKWLSSNITNEDIKLFPIQGQPSPDGFDRRGLYKQLAWLANQLNNGYYNWKYGNLKNLEFEDGTRLKLAPELNAGTVGIQRFFSIQLPYPQWESAVSAAGLYQTYAALFGETSADTNVNLVPSDLVQPLITLPFPAGQTWLFTGGPHGGWGSGSAWSAIDFAPPDDRTNDSPLCYISEFWVTAVADGVIARSEDGAVLLDLDSDGDDTTGWGILYLHMAAEGRVAAGTVVKAGDQIGKPSCEGGFSTATHMHIARLYNGEWIPVSGDGVAPFVMSGWTVFGFSGQEYQGYMLKNGERRDAEQGRLTPINRVSW